MLHECAQQLIAEVVMVNSKSFLARLAGQKTEDGRAAVAQFREGCVAQRA